MPDIAQGSLPGVRLSPKLVDGVTSDEDLIFINQHVLFLFVCSRGLDYAYVCVGPLLHGDVPPRDGSVRSRAIALWYAFEPPEECDKLPREDRARIKSTLLKTKERIKDLVEEGCLDAGSGLSSGWWKTFVAVINADSPTPWRSELSFYV